MQLAYTIDKMLHVLSVLLSHIPFLQVQGGDEDTNEPSMVSIQSVFSNAMYAVTEQW